ncbi:endolytic transglycosylase MltG [Patescibacteria group bacterium]|nr:endolytic transglycosylase MltG [Patescibacteria group bacterium]
MFEELDEKKYHVLSPGKKRALVLLIVFFIVVCAPLLGFLYYKFAVRRPSQFVDELTYEVKKGATLSEITNDLYNLGALNSKVLFNFYLYLNKIDQNIQAGMYVIPAGVSVVELADLLQHGVNDVEVRFIEGWRVEEYAREATKKFSHIDYKDFLSVAKNYEGYLFPDTYMFNLEIQEEEMVDTLLSTYEKRTRDLFTAENLAGVGLTEEEVIIFASIVEREAMKEEDRPIVAGILIKRWRENMPIGADATTQYAVAVDKFCVPDSCRSEGVLCSLPEEVGYCQQELTKEQAMEIDWWPKELTQYDLDFDSFYNTRKNPGLPPKPISNPGISSIRSVLEYEDTNYYYYLHDEEGNTYFAKDLETHEENIAKYLN